MPTPEINKEVDDLIKFVNDQLLHMDGPHPRQFDKRAPVIRVIATAIVMREHRLKERISSLEKSRELDRVRRRKSPYR